MRTGDGHRAAVLQPEAVAQRCSQPPVLFGRGGESDGVFVFDGFGRVVGGVNQGSVEAAQGAQCGWDGQVAPAWRVQIKIAFAPAQTDIFRAGAAQTAVGGADGLRPVEHVVFQRHHDVDMSAVADEEQRDFPAGLPVVDAERRQRPCRQKISGGSGRQE